MLLLLVCIHKPKDGQSNHHWQENEMMGNKIFFVILVLLLSHTRNNANS